MDFKSIFLFSFIFSFFLFFFFILFLFHFPLNISRTKHSLYVNSLFVKVIVYFNMIFHIKMTFLFIYILCTFLFVFGINPSIVQNIFKLIHYYNIRLFYRIRKVVENIFINVPSYERKKLWDKDDLVKTIQKCNLFDFSLSILN